MSTQVKTVDIAKDFTRYPAGRFLKDGPFSGEAFQQRFLLPAIKNNEHLVIRFDGAAGYGSSFLEEAFGGLVRLGYAPDKVLSTFEIDTQDGSLKAEIVEYIQNALPH